MNGERSGGVPLFNRQPGSWSKSGSLQITKYGGAAVGDAADDASLCERPARQGHFIAEHSGCKFLRNHVTVRVELHQIGSTIHLRAQYVGTRAVNRPYTTQVNGYQTVCQGCFAPFPYGEPLDPRC